MRWPILFLLCACATGKAVQKSECELAFDRCNNGCFKQPRYTHGGERCTDTAVGTICPQENQLVDTVEAGKCFEKCEWDRKLCR